MNYSGNVIIKAGYNSNYNNINLAEYYEKAYEVGKKLIEMIGD